jgi:hypothetical protein
VAQDALCRKLRATLPTALAHVFAFQHFAALQTGPRAPPTSLFSIQRDCERFNLAKDGRWWGAARGARRAAPLSPGAGSSQMPTRTTVCARATRSC